jgi:hypothetical protein
MFEARATESELLDQPEFDPGLAIASYRFMERVNVLFGGIRVVRRFLAAETKGRRAATPLRLLDIGSGSCDIPLAISRWARARDIPVHITCLEMADPAAALARSKLARSGDKQVDLLQEDVFTHQPRAPYDYAISSMCFHHFSDEQIMTLLVKLRGFVRRGVLINDLRRSPWAFWAVTLLLVGAPAGVRHDARLSIRRGFKVQEMKNVLAQLAATEVSVEPAPWFRIAAVIRFKSGENE